MAEGEPGEPPAIPLEIVNLVDSICDRYEQAWSRGESPRIEDYLAGVPPLAIPALLRELLLLEIDLARGSGQSTLAANYLVRFPDHAEVVASALLESSTTQSPVSLEGECDNIASPGDDRFESHRPAPDRLKIPGYEVLGVLGRGGMGVVYRAREIRLNRIIALKMLPAGTLATPEQLARFRTEAATVARIQHPNVVRIHSVGDHEEMPFIEMEFVGGGSLAARLDGTPWPPDQAASLVASLASGVEEMHRLGVIHRDIKPGNVMIDQEGIPKLGDFGLAKDMAGDSGLTRTDAIMGSPSYMAPEQAAGGSREAGPPADVYSLGAVLYELLSGRPPFRGATVLETLRQVRSTEPVAPARLVPGLSRDVETICLHCLSKDPARRYASAKDLADDLGRYLRRESISARPVGPIGRAARWASRNRLAAGLMVTVAVAVVGGFVGMVILSARATASAKQANRLLAEMALDRGNALGESGRAARGLHWLSAALQYDPDDGAGLRPVVLGGLAAWGRQVPRLLGSVASIGPFASDEFTTDGLAYAAGGLDGSLSVWRLSDLNRRIFLPAGGKAIVDITFDASGRRLASADAEGTVQVWDVATARPDGPALHHPEPVNRLEFRDGGRSLLAVRGGEVWIWELNSSSPPSPAVVQCGGGEVRVSAFSPDGSILVTAMESNEVRHRDGRTGLPLGPAWIAPAEIRSIAFSPDGRRFAVGYGSATRLAGDKGGGSGVQFFDADGRPDGSPLLHDAGVNRLRYRPDGRVLLAGDWGGTLRLWDVRERRKIGEPLALDGGVGILAISPDGRFALACSTAGNVRLWDTSNGNVAGAVFDHPGSPRGVFRPDGRSIAVAGSRTLTIFDVAEIRAPSVLVHRNVKVARFLSSGRALLTAGGDRTARLCDPSNGSPLATPMPHRGQIDALDVHPDGRTIATGARDMEVRFWDTDGRPAGPPIPQSHWVADLRFVDDGRRLVVGRVDNTTQVFEVATGKPIGPVIRHPGKAKGDEVRYIRLLPGGKTALSISTDGTIGRIDIGTCKLVGEFQMIPRSLVATELSPDGQTLLAVAKGEVYLSEAATGRRTAPPFGLAITSGAFLDGGRVIVTGSDDRTARLWDATTGRPIGGPIEHDRPVRSVAANPAGGSFLTMTDDGRARLWDTASRKPIGPAFPSGGSPNLDRPTFSPDGRSVVLVGDVAEIWPVPTAADVDPTPFTWDLRTSTGLAVDEHGGFDRLEAEKRPAGDPKPLPDDGWLYREARARATQGDWAGTLWLLDRLVAGRPGDWPTHVLRARALAQLGRAPEPQKDVAAGAEASSTPDQAATADAEIAFDAILDGRWADAAAGLGRVLARRPDDWPLRVERGWARARAGDWAGAEADLGPAGPGRSRMLSAIYQRALVALKAGDGPGYRDLCRSLVDDWVPGKSSGTSMIAWICALGEGSIADRSLAIRAVEPLALAGPARGDRLALLALGANYYRDGRFAETVNCFERDAREWADGGSPAGWAFLAMACHRLGREDEARKWLGKVAEKVEASSASPDPGDDFWDSVELRILKAEADADAVRP